MTWTPPPLDPAIAAALAADPDAVVGMEPEDIAVIRGRAVPVPPEQVTRYGTFERTDLTFPSAADGADVRVVLVRPVRTSGPLPVIVHIHGGGLVLGGPLDDLPATLELAAHTGCAVASVDYRLAPEHPYPTPVLDCYGALTGLREVAREWNLDPTRMILSGVSAGGGLAAAVALWGRDHDGPDLLGLLLACPMLDDRNETFSAQQMRGVGTWDLTANATGWRAYLGDAAGGPDVPIYAAPGRAQDLSGLPPAFVDVATVETFRDECVAFASRIWQAGGSAELHVWPGGNHAFDFLAPWATLSQDARAARLAWLRRLLLDA
ncbi:alpha/beta hydrolase [Georgenia sp. 311]|uniref:alpha/beta hydrolase fold domain-containing protein n=1 Tax=Georgenia sp. 311 TaxID=2585134 RepID=UPI001111C836|nr:alpha/beta hydrolase fold domain-containing protein [Georgenia sp. 311]TNC20557.1 alpha/beta hydrolase [Georgenia sp. 311]